MRRFFLIFRKNQTHRIRIFDIFLPVGRLARMYEAAGKIKLIYDTQTFASGFSKREFVVTTAADKFPQDLKFEVVKDKCALLDNFKNGQDVTVNFDIRGNEYNGKYYVNLSAWKIQGGNGGSASGDDYSQDSPPMRRPAARQTMSDVEPSAADLRKDDDFDDDIPF
jgi:single-strand DNA-binding protein